MAVSPPLKGENQIPFLIGAALIILGISMASNLAGLADRIASRNAETEEDWLIEAHKMKRLGAFAAMTGAAYIAGVLILF
ncbi:hypothetical protein [Streptomyces sodiiphilus]|uniref:hypothetical protein n=1 Tax=Streptomyces sodiiphilus TaxID=226217 RepID=UPI0031D590C8